MKDKMTDQLLQIPSTRKQVNTAIAASICSQTPCTKKLLLFATGSGSSGLGKLKEAFCMHRIE